MTEINRRTMLASAITAGAAATMGSLASSPAKAAMPLQGKQAPGWYRYKVGSYEVTVVTDGAATFPLPDHFVANASKEQVSAELAKHHVDPTKVTVPFTPIIINNGSKLILIDTGWGEPAGSKPGATNGMMMANMRAAGIDPKAIDTVIISHFHGDHINGLLNAENKLAFPNAEVMVPSVEWKYWMDDGELSRAPAGRMQGLFKNNRRVFDALGRNTDAARALAMAAIDAHRLYVGEARHPIEVRADEAHLVPWLSRRVGTKLKAPNLQSEGLRLLGGRLLSRPNGAAALLMYQSAGGERITLTTTRSSYQGDETSFQWRSKNGVGAIAWLENGLAFVVAGPAERDRLDRIARRVCDAYEVAENSAAKKQ